MRAPSMSRCDAICGNLATGTRADAERENASLAAAYRKHRPTVIAYLRLRRYPPEQAEDLAQGFFEQLLLHRTCDRVDPARGDFRAFLSTALKRFLANRQASARACKRGGGQPAIRMDRGFELADPRTPTPEQAYESGCALAAVARALARLEAETGAACRHDWFDALREFLVEPPDAEDYERLARRLGIRRNTIAVALCRLRGRLRELVREELDGATGTGRPDARAPGRLRGAAAEAALTRIP